jgi:hypothetical protein
VNRLGPSGATAAKPPKAGAATSPEPRTGGSGPAGAASLAKVGRGADGEIRLAREALSTSSPPAAAGAALAVPAENRITGSGRDAGTAVFDRAADAGDAARGLATGGLATGGRDTEKPRNFLASAGALARTATAAAARTAMTWRGMGLDPERRWCQALRESRGGSAKRNTQKCRSLSTLPSPSLPRSCLCRP